MCLSATESFSALSIMVVLAVFIKIRNIKYDSIVAALIICISLIQLIELLYHRHLISGPTAGRCIFMILWLQVLVNAITTNSYYNTSFTTHWLIFAIIIIMVALFSLDGNNFNVSEGNGHLVWTRNGGRILGSARGIYLLGLMLPFLVILWYTKGCDLGAWILLAVGVITGVTVRKVYPRLNFSTMWCYSAIAFAFAGWMIMAFSEGGVKHSHHSH